MNITIKTDESLAKKINALADKGATIIITVNDYNSEKRRPSNLIIKNDDGEIEIKNVNINFDNIKEEDVPYFEVGNLFSSGKSDNDENIIENKIIRKEPKEISEVSREIKKNASVPEDFKQLKDKTCKVFINNLETLIQAVNDAKNKTSSVGDMNNITDIRKRAVLMEQKELEESIDIPAFIVSEAKMSINDIGIILEMGVPYDLTRISAKRLASSRDLISLIKSGIVKFINPEDVKKYMEEAENRFSSDHGLKTYDRKTAERAINEEDSDEDFDKETKIIDPSSVGLSKLPKTVKKTVSDDDMEEYSAEELERPTEEEIMITNLTKNSPTIKTTHSNNNIKKPINAPIIKRL